MEIARAESEVEGSLPSRYSFGPCRRTTNVAFDKNEDELYVTVVKDPKDSQAKGTIVKINNVE